MIVTVKPGRVMTGMAVPARSGSGHSAGRSARSGGGGGGSGRLEEDVVRFVLDGEIRCAGTAGRDSALGVDPLDERRAGQQVAWIIGGTRCGTDGDKQPGDILGGIVAVRRRDNSVLADGAAVGLVLPCRPYEVLD